jgi:hypothetical protein
LDDGNAYFKHVSHLLPGAANKQNPSQERCLDFILLFPKSNRQWALMLNK